MALPGLLLPQPMVSGATLSRGSGTSSSAAPPLFSSLSSALPLRRLPRRLAVASRSRHLLCYNSSSASNGGSSSSVAQTSSGSATESELLQLLQQQSARTTSLATEQRILGLIHQLEDQQQQSGYTYRDSSSSEVLNDEEQKLMCEQPAASAVVEGDWELLFTTKSKFNPLKPLGERVDGTAPGLEKPFEMLSNAVRKLREGSDDTDSNRAAPAPSSSETSADGGSSSPIQRTITTTKAFTVTQSICLQNSSITAAQPPRVDQVVQFNDSFLLRLSASGEKASNNPRRINFTFDLAYFEINFGGKKYRVPYPVPFKLLGKEAQGWLDTSYLSPKLRVSLGNKGTTFVLRKLGGPDAETS